jgi:ParB family chromosome partitioning protein
MSTPKRGLGRGLDALIPTNAFESRESAAPPPAGTAVVEAPIGSVARNPRQPRTVFDPQALQELAASIREHGVLQPLVVSPGDGPDRYVLIAGERRLEAGKLAGLETVPVIVRGASDQQRLELALIENIQRADLGPLETALAYHHLAQDFGLSHESIAERVGKSRVAVTNTLRLLRLPAIVQNALSGGVISEGHARALLQLPTPEAIEAAFTTVVKKTLTVRQTEELVRQLMGERPERPSTERHADSDALAEALQSTLLTRVQLKRSRGGGGTLSLHFSSDEELNAFAERILGSNL